MGTYIQRAETAPLWVMKVLVKTVISVCFKQTLSLVILFNAHDNISHLPFARKAYAIFYGDAVIGLILAPRQVRPGRS